MRAILLLIIATLVGCLQAPMPGPPSPTPNECRCCEGCCCRVNPPAPQPTPTPVPEPPQPPPKTTGRVVFLLDESSRQTPEFARLRIGITSGAANKWLMDRGYAIQFLDQDYSQTPLVARLKSEAAGKSLPVVFVCELSELSKVGRTLISESVRPDMTADNVVELVKRSGG